MNYGKNESHTCWTSLFVIWNWIDRVNSVNGRVWLSNSISWKITLESNFSLIISTDNIDEF